MAGVADTVDTVAEGTAAAVLSPPCPATLLQMVLARLVAATAAALWLVILGKRQHTRARFEEF